MRLASVTVALAAVAAGVFALAPSAHAVSSAPAVNGPIARVVYPYSSPQPSWAHWSSGGQRHYFGTFRITSNSTHDVIYQSSGTYFAYSACTLIRLRYMVGDSSTVTAYYEPQTPLRVCGGGQVYLDRDAPTNMRFYWECRPEAENARTSDNPCTGSITF